MIGKDRLELNKRFCIAFKLLEENGIIAKNDRNGKGIGDFAERVLGNKSYGHIVRAFLTPGNQRVVSYSQARTFCTEYGVNESWMLDGIGTPFGLDVRASTSVDKTGGNILFTSVEAFAGSTVDPGGFSSENCSFFSLPDLNGDSLVAFPVKGNSMEPVIANGDIVVCRELDSFKNVRDNEIYAIKSNGSVWVKYVRQIPDERQRISRLKLISANNLEYDPFIEEVNEFTRLYKVIRKISAI